MRHSGEESTGSCSASHVTSRPTLRSVGGTRSVADRPVISGLQVDERSTTGAALDVYFGSLSEALMLVRS